jgi:TRAP-type transport system periplasmic protein
MKVLLTAALCAVLLVPALEATAQTVVKLATLVPDGSPWHRVLQDQAADWRRDSGGQVELRIYPGGVAGDDPDMVRKLRIGQFQAAMVSVQGLGEIDEAFKVFQVPLFFDSVEELQHVLGQMEPLLRQRLEAKGFMLLNWSYAGWVHLYSKKPIRSIGDLRAQKLFLWGSDERALRLWRQNGLQPVGLASTDMLMALQTGMIEAFATTPLAVLSVQWHRAAPFQLDQGLAPLLGATIMTRRSFNALPQEHRAALVQAATKAGDRFWTEIPQQERRAIAELQARGLTVTGIDAAARAEWTSATGAFVASARDAIAPQDIYDVALRHRDAYRAARTR